MISTDSTHYSFPTGVVVPFAREWQMSGTKIEQLNDCIERWEKAVGARLFKADSDLGFDWVLAVPCEENNRNVISDNQIIGEKHYSGRVKILVKLLPSGRVYSMLSDILPLEGEESNQAIQNWIAQNLEDKSVEWTGNIADLLGGRTSVVSSFNRFIYKPFIQAQLIEQLGLGKENLSFPVNAYITPFAPVMPVNFEKNLISQSEANVFLYFADHRGNSRPSLRVNKEFFTSNRIAIEKGTCLGTDILDINLGYLSDSIQYHFELEIFKARRNSITRAFNDFQGKLNSEILDISKNASNEYSGKYYNWIQHDNPLIALYRKQSLETYPLLISRTLSGMFIEDNDQSKRNADLLVSCVDNGSSTIELLSDLWELPKLAVRSLQGVTAEQLQSSTLVNAGFETIKIFKPYIKEDWWPDRSGSVDISVQWYNFLSTLLEIKYWKDADWRNMSLCNDYASSLACTQAFWRTHPALFFCQNVQDMAEKFGEQMILPLVIQGCRENNQHIPEWIDLVKQMGYSVDGTSLIEAALIRGKTYKGLNLLSEIWHGNYSRIQTEIVSQTDHRCWPALIQPQKLGDLCAISLCSAAELACESSKMNHCVGSYVAKCLNERCHIISLRDDQNNSMSTIEIRMIFNHSEEPDFEIIQHQACKNTVPEDMDRAAAQELLQGLKNQTVQVDWKTIEQDFKTRKDSDSDEIDMNIGYPHSSAQARDAALQAWSFCLPKKYRSLTHAEWSKRIGLDVLVKKILDASLNSTCNPEI